MCVCVCVCIYRCIYIYTQIQVFANIQNLMMKSRISFLKTLFQLCVYAHAQACRYKHTHGYTYRYEHTCVSLVSAHKHTHIHIQTFAPHTHTISLYLYISFSVTHSFTHCLMREHTLPLILSLSLSLPSLSCTHTQTHTHTHANHIYTHDYSLIFTQTFMLYMSMCRSVEIEAGRHTYTRCPRSTRLLHHLRESFSVWSDVHEASALTSAVHAACPSAPLNMSVLPATPPQPCRHTTQHMHPQFSIDT